MMLFGIFAGIFTGLCLGALALGIYLLKDEDLSGEDEYKDNNL